MDFLKLLRGFSFFYSLRGVSNSFGCAIFIVLKFMCWCATLHWTIFCRSNARRLTDHSLTCWPTGECFWMLWSVREYMFPNFILVKAACFWSCTVVSKKVVYISLDSFLSCICFQLLYFHHETFPNNLMLFFIFLFDQASFFYWNNTKSVIPVFTFLVFNVLAVPNHFFMTVRASLFFSFFFARAPLVCST